MTRLRRDGHHDFAGWATGWILQGGVQGFNGISAGLPLIEPAAQGPDVMKSPRIELPGDLLCGRFVRADAIYDQLTVAIDRIRSLGRLQIEQDRSGDLHGFCNSN
jgi:hypothetical protein